MDITTDVRALGDKELLTTLHRLVADERNSAVHILACLAEVERRRLFAEEGYPSLFAYCVEDLHYSDGGAARRMHAARAASKFPAIYSMLRDGSLSLGSIALLAPHLNQSNHEQLLNAAQGKTRRDLERMIAELSPRPDSPDRMALASVVKPPIRPDPDTTSPEAAGVVACTPRTFTPQGAAPLSDRKDTSAPIAPQRVYFSFTGSEGFRAEIERLKEILRRKYPAGKLEDILGETVDEYLERHDPDRKEEAVRREQTAEARRRIPQWVQDRVWKRDGGSCVFIGRSGHRCGQRNWLEFDHVWPWALGGRSDDPDNIRLLCRVHNQLTARKMFGAKADRKSGGGTVSLPSPT